MEREKKTQYRYAITTRFPLFFWRECCICHKEFRREKMWETVTEPFFNRVGTTKHLCKKCAPTKDRAHEIFRNREWIPPQPKHLPPPPPPRPPKRIIVEGRGIIKEK